jgi:CarD family transcriptional regulator
MKVMVPIDSIETHGIRSVISASKVSDVYGILSGEASIMNKNWSKRYRENEIKIRNGDIFEIAEIVKNLTLADRDKRLSTGEKRMLETARNILISELMLVLNESSENILNIVEKRIGQCNKM